MDTRTETSVSNYLKKPLTRQSYRLEVGFRNPSSLKTRPNTQISTFSQTFTNTPLEIQKETSEIISGSKKNSILKPRTYETLEPQRKTLIGNWKIRTSRDMKINTKQFQNLKIADINSSNELRPFDFRPHTQVSSRKQTENELRSSRSIKDNNDNGTFSSLEFPQDSFSGSLIKALFRQNNIKSVRNSLIEQTVGLKRKTSDSPILNFKNYKFPNMPEGVGNKKEFEVYLNMKNYKLSKNILNWLKKVCETTLKERPKTSDHAYVDQKIMDIYTTLLHHLSNIPSMINECVNNRDNREDLFSSISLMAAELMQTKDFGLYVESLKLQAKIFKIYGDFSKSLQTYTQAMQLCNKHNLYKLKTKVYKRLGKLYLELQNLPKAKSNFIKSLQMAWFVSSQKYELLAYDLLGLIAYYEGSIEKAKYYHNRMITCELEDINSAIRLVAISKIKNKIEMRRSMENNFMLDANVVSSDEEEEGLYEVKKKKEDFEIYLTKSEAARKRIKGISFGEKQKMLIKQTGSSMFKNKVNVKEEFLPEGVIKKIRRRLQKEREMANLVETSKKTNIHDVLKQLPEEISNGFFSSESSNAHNTVENKKYPLDLIKGIYGIQKSIILKDCQKIENFKFMKTTSINKNTFFLSHLSSNRNLDRFSRVFDPNQYKKKNANTEIKLFLDKKTSQKIKKSLLKFKSNIIVAVSRLETIKRGQFLYPTNSLYIRRGGLSVN